MDICIVLLTLLPFAMLGGVRWARRRQHRAHRNVQVACLVVVALCVGLLETDIRLSGGTVAYLSRGSASLGFLRAFLAAHVLVATGTFGLWLALVLRSWRRSQSQLPGAFSSTHRRLGKLTLFGVGLLSSSGLLLYLLVFVR